MNVTIFKPRAVPKVWGCEHLPHPFNLLQTGNGAVGEVWFEGAEDAELLAKFLFTSQRLSIQVHPDEQAARAAGLKRGKDEAWLVLSAEPSAKVGLGPKQEITRQQLSEAAVSGDIETLIDWKPVGAGDFIFSPAGTIHAIGAGLTLLELQQHSDATYRLYDYGRERELHLAAAVDAARLQPWHRICAPRRLGEGRQLLATGGTFTVERWRSRKELRVSAGAAELMMIPLNGAADVEGFRVTESMVAGVTGRGGVQPRRAVDMLVAYPGPMRPSLVATGRSSLIGSAGMPALPVRQPHL